MWKREMIKMIKNRWPVETEASLPKLSEGKLTQPGKESKGLASCLRVDRRELWTLGNEDLTGLWITDLTGSVSIRLSLPPSICLSQTPKQTPTRSAHSRYLHSSALLESIIPSGAGPVVSLCEGDTVQAFQTRDLHRASPESIYHSRSYRSSHPIGMALCSLWCCVSLLSLMCGFSAHPFDQK